MTLNLASIAAQNTGGAGTDTIIASESVAGSSHADMLTGNVADNTFLGGGGDDTLSGASGDDTLDGGPGTDTVDYTSSALGVVVDLSLAGAQPTGAGADTLSGVENLTGGAGRDVLRGDGGNILTGGAGNDVLAGTAGNDLLDAGAGVDSSTTRPRGAPVVLSLTTGTATTSGGTDTLVAFENATGGSAADTSPATARRTS